MTTQIDARRYAERMLACDDILIIIHRRPDGDAIGSGSALLNLLLALGKRAILACCDELPHHEAFIAGYTEASACFYGSTDFPFEPKAVFTIDIAAPTLILGELTKYAEQVTLALDHHEINTLNAKELFLESQSSSAGETLYQVIPFLRELSGKELPDAKTASALYASIVSDSGNFKYGNTSPRTLRSAADLIEYGADNERISRLLFDTRTPAILRAEALCMEHIGIFEDGRLAISYLTDKDREEKQLSDGDCETCVQVLRSLEGVEIAAFLKEQAHDEDGRRRFRISFRSNEYADVASLATHFGGGGHKKASGGTVTGNPEEAIEELRRAMREFL